VRPQLLLTVADVERSSRWYQHVLGARSAHGGDEYERLVVGDDDLLVLQLHRWDVDHHHGGMGDPDDRPYGNGVLVWFETDEFDEAAARARDAASEIVLDAHVNPNARHREIWVRDPDGYVVVLASPDGEVVEAAE
jgi:catechol 2,3-dioxygenase-like lactoylglutathione lyase family enzyme